MLERGRKSTVQRGAARTVVTVLTCSALRCIQLAVLDDGRCYFHAKIREGLLVVPYGGVFSQSRRRDTLSFSEIKAFVDQRERPSEPVGAILQA